MSIIDKKPIPSFQIYNSKVNNSIINNIESLIPNIIHFIFGLIPQNEEFNMYRYIAVKSAYDVDLNWSLPSNFMDEAAAAQSDDTRFWSFLLVLFFTAYPNLKLPGDTFDNAQKRAIFTAFYDFLNAHDLKIKAL